MPKGKSFRSWLAISDQQPNLLLVAAWFGLATGFIEVFVLLSGKVFFHKLLLFGPQVIWMAPLADLIFFVICGCSLLILQRLLKIGPLPVIIFIFAFFSFLGLTLMFAWLQHYAALLLSAGLPLTSGPTSR